MDILHVNNYHYVRGGSDSVYFNTFKMLENSGHIGRCYAGAHTENRYSPYQEYFPTSVDTTSAGVLSLNRFLHNSDARKNLTKLIRDHGPFDLAHLHIYHGRLTASILKPLREAGIPIVQSLHEYKLACPVYTMERNGKTCDACVSGSTLNVIRNRCKNRSFAHSFAMLAEYWASRAQGDVRLVDRFICVSDFQLGVMRRANIPADKLTRLHNFVDTSRISPVNVEDKQDYFLYFGRIEELKGLPTLIKAIKSTRFRLKVVGSGAWLGEMKSAISECDNVEYLGFKSGTDLYNLVAKARAVVVPSEWFENCPMSVLEAKASGTAVIGSNIGGIPELIRNRVDGFLFEPGDPAALAEALNDMASVDLCSFSRAAREDAVGRFSHHVYLKKLLNIYSAARNGYRK